MGKLLVPSKDSVPPVSGKPRQKLEGDVLIKEKLGWDDDAPSQIKYTPYLVNVTARTADQASFSFIHTDTGKVVGGVHTLSIKGGKDGKDDKDAKEWDVFHPGYPSTLPTVAQFQEKLTVCIVMLNDTRMSDTMHTDALMTNAAASGKWPRTSYDELLGAFKLLSQLPGFKALKTQLPAHLQHLLDTLV